MATSGPLAVGKALYANERGGMVDWVAILAVLFGTALLALSPLRGSALSGARRILQPLTSPSLVQQGAVAAPGSAERAAHRSRLPARGRVAGSEGVSGREQSAEHLGAGEFLVRLAQQKRLDHWGHDTSFGADEFQFEVVEAPGGVRSDALARSQFAQAAAAAEVNGATPDALLHRNVDSSASTPAGYDGEVLAAGAPALPWVFSSVAAWFAAVAGWNSTAPPPVADLGDGPDRASHVSASTSTTVGSLPAKPLTRGEDEFLITRQLNGDFLVTNPHGTPPHGKEFPAWLRRDGRLFVAAPVWAEPGDSPRAIAIGRIVGETLFVSTPLVDFISNFEPESMNFDHESDAARFWKGVEASVEVAREARTNRTPMQEDPRPRAFIQPDDTDIKRIRWTDDLGVAAVVDLADEEVLEHPGVIDTSVVTSEGSDSGRRPLADPEVGERWLPGKFGEVLSRIRRLVGGRLGSPEEQPGLGPRWSSLRAAVEAVREAEQAVKRLEGRRDAAERLVSEQAHSHQATSWPAEAQAELNLAQGTLTRAREEHRAAATALKDSLASALQQAHPSIPQAARARIELLQHQVDAAREELDEARAAVEALNDSYDQLTGFPSARPYSGMPLESINDLAELVEIQEGLSAQFAQLGLDVPTRSDEGSPGGRHVPAEERDLIVQIEAVSARINLLLGAYGDHSRNIIPMSAEKVERIREVVTERMSAVNDLRAAEEAHRAAKRALDEAKIEALLGQR